MSLRPFATAKYAPRVKLAAAAELELRRRAQPAQASGGTLAWRDWLASHFPAYTTAPMPDDGRHAGLWEWFEGLTPGVKPAARIELWARGGAKSSTAELGVTRTGHRKARTFALYVSGAQAQADKHVQSIAALFEHLGIDRAVNKYNQSKGWTQQILRAANGFNVVSLGLDAGVRGVKLDQYRPDLIILDDVDNRHDSAAVVAKKIETITESILPTGAPDYAVLFIQNMVHKDSVAAQLYDGRAAFLLDRDPIRLWPAVEGLTYEQTPEGTFRITGGTPTWAGQSLATCQSQMNDWGVTAFLQEAQHEVDDPDGGMYGHLVWRRCARRDVPPLARVCVWCDPAVTNTDDSDCHGIQVDGVAQDSTIYRLFSWEQRSTPQDVLCRGILKALEYGAQIVGVETDQGGDTWHSVFHEAWRAISEERETEDGLDHLIRQHRATFRALQEQAGRRLECPAFRSAKAGAGYGGKIERQSKMLSGYERGGIVHVEGTHLVLEKALRRFPKAKPYDLADACFVAGTQITTINGLIPIEHIKPGMQVLTRMGYKPVTAAGLTSNNAEVIEVEFTDGSRIVATPNHPIWTENRGFVRLDALSWCDIIVSCQNEKQPNTKGLHTSATPTHRTGRTGYTTGRAGQVASTCIRTFGRMHTGLFRLIADTKFTTSTETHLITPWRTWNSSRLDSIVSAILKNINYRHNVQRICKQRPQSGIEAKQGGHGIENTGSKHGMAESTAPQLVNIAAMSLILGMLVRTSASVLGNVRTPSMMQAEHIAKSAYARGVEPPSWQKLATHSDVALVRVRRISKVGRATVWNLSVAECPEYLANGILVHNCFWSWNWLSGGGMGNSAVGAFG